MVAMVIIMDKILMNISKCKKLLMDIWVRDGPWSTDQGISWPGARLLVNEQLKIFKMAAVAAVVDIVTICF